MSVLDSALLKYSWEEGKKYFELMKYQDLMDKSFILWREKTLNVKCHQNTNPIEMIL